LLGWVADVGIIFGQSPKIIPTYSHDPRTYRRT
jgi:hypothetical protein